MATTSNYALRLLASVKTEEEKAVAAEGTTLNQFVSRAYPTRLLRLVVDLIEGC